jgi:glycosyltransferase involved in cell wall biosynthesis
MSRLLLLGYHFPPLGGAGVQRNAKLARYLPEFGYDLTVITGPASSEAHVRWTPVDETMIDEVPASVEVVRIDGPEPTWQQSRLDKAQRWLRIRRAWQRWWEREAVRAAVAAGQDVDVVYASLSPYLTADAAVEVARRLSKPLVFDLEDPWVFDEMLEYETALHSRLDARTMRRALNAADAIVMNTPEAAARLVAAFPELAAKPVTAVLNGYDAADFAGETPSRSDEALRIVHTGSLHSGSPNRPLLRRLLGGYDPGVDAGTRSLELHLAGRLTDGDRAVLRDVPGVHEHGFLPHAETISLIRSADLLFLPMHEVQPGRRVAIVPCKTYEYLAAERPILAAVPDGDARDLLLESGAALVCRPSDATAMEGAIAAALENGPASVVPNRLLLQRLERRSLTRDLVEFLESSVVEAAPARRDVILASA